MVLRYLVLPLLVAALALPTLASPADGAAAGAAPAAAVAPVSGEALRGPDRAAGAPSLQQTQAADDDRVTVMLAVFGAAGFAVLVGTLGYLLRRLLRLVAPPPQQPPPEHH